MHTFAALDRGRLRHGRSVHGSAPGGSISLKLWLLSTHPLFLTRVLAAFAAPPSVKLQFPPQRSEGLPIRVSHCLELAAARQKQPTSPPQRLQVAIAIMSLRTRGESVEITQRAESLAQWKGQLNKSLLRVEQKS